MSDLPVAFQFAVLLDGGNAHGPEASFREVSGIGASMELEPYAEGGENRFVHQLPKGVKQSPLVLKRGIAPPDSDFVTWCKATLEGGLCRAITPRLLQVRLMNNKGDPLIAWSFSNVYPVKWTVDAFESTKNQVAVETIELAYTTAVRIRCTTRYEH
jgi:phage tail-like protein